MLEKTYQPAVIEAREPSDLAAVRKGRHEPAVLESKKGKEAAEDTAKKTAEPTEPATSTAIPLTTRTDPSPSKPDSSFTSRGVSVTRTDLSAASTTVCSGVSTTSSSGKGCDGSNARVSLPATKPASTLRGRASRCSPSSS